LLIIYGPTAVGKTSLAFGLARKYNGDILSADSRQVYRGMDIITGKDLPKNSKFEILNLKTKDKLGYWEAPEGVRVWLTDLVDPKEEFSVAQWVGYAKEVMDLVWKDGKLPIIVGGTGFYIKALIDGFDTLEIKPNKRLRENLIGKTAEELFETLASVNSIRAGNMNQSDRKNPRRLMRAIEVALSKQNGSLKTKSNGSIISNENLLFIGLKAPRNLLYERIDSRVDARVAGGIEETKKLLQEGVMWDDQSMTGIGYSELKEYILGKVSLDEAVARWKKSEQDYAKRQLLWFKNDKRALCFDTTQTNWETEVEKTVENWYDKGE